jgi:hypothetical protein
MKTRLFSILAVVVLVLAVSGTAVAAPGLPKATGGGIVEWPGGNVTYGFTAQQVDSTGNATGQAQFHHRDSDLSNHVEVLYLAVDTATGDAWVGGNITKSTNPAYVGMEVYWRVQDNGEGGKATGPDMVSTVVIGSPAITALAKPALPLRAWTNGNVQVR